MENNKLVTPEYLLSHGFKKYTHKDIEADYRLPYKIPDVQDDEIGFCEIEFNRQMFVIVFSQYMDNEREWHRNVYVQEDAGCGFIELPFPWSYLPIEYFEAVYYGIRGEKPKCTEPHTEDIDHEVINPKLIQDERKT